MVLLRLLTRCSQRKLVEHIHLGSKFSFGNLGSEHGRCLVGTAVVWGVGEHLTMAHLLFNVQG